MIDAEEPTINCEKCGTSGDVRAVILKSAWNAYEGLQKLLCHFCRSQVQFKYVNPNHWVDFFKDIGPQEFKRLLSGAKK